MKSYFIAINEDAKKRLQEAEVSFCNFNIGDNNGVIINPDVIRPALEALGAEIDKEEKTQFAGVFSLQLLFKVSPEELAEIALHEEEEEFRQSRKRYTSECSARFEKTLRSTQEKISSGAEKISDLQKTLVRSIREVSGAERKLAQMETCRNGELDKYGQEFDKLLAVPGICNVKVTDGVIKVFSDTLYCVDPRSGSKHEIGAFRIEIYTNGANDGVRWFNLSHRINGYKEKMHAPHVFPKGNACLGNTAEIFPELIANYEFAAVAMVAIQFIESINVDDDAGKHIHRWPLADIALQSEAGIAMIKKMEEERKNNPFFNYNGDLKFAIVAKNMNPRDRIVNCGTCWCVSNENCACKTEDLAAALSTSEATVRETLMAYFKIG